MKYLTNRKLWAAIIGLVTAIGTLMVTLDEVKANTSFPQGFNVTYSKVSKVDNSNGRVHYVKVDSSLDGVPNSGYDIEIPQFP